MRTKTTPNQVDHYLDTLQADKLPLAIKLRNIIQNAVPHLEETFRWDNPCYFFYGPVCYFASSRNCLHLGFFRGEELDDPAKRLVSRKGGYPHIILRTEEDIDQPYFEDLIRQAVTLNQN
ncbi:DUF1801 domain-containing protein [Pontibacter qinzhouensis]|uniref:DUF1801 domain-containing protein n=1 Tax=Pontibacter qinzhouensis TaxID=2603253 RepID=A0A5C8KDD4_9BACT|nr:DUF1801 domain-containing protein [Pontibacter qinzhouensis]TXK51877.1 DUF1801 domain-containing protein [Pontibacter qinzhouensis]